MKKSVEKTRIIFSLFILVLFIFFNLLNLAPVSAHLPMVEDKENYVPNLGWIKTIEGEAEIKTSDTGYISISLEDYDKHQSILTVNPNSKIKLNLSEGKHFDDTISMKWYLDPHQVSLTLEKGDFNLIITTDENRYKFLIKTPNAKVELPYRLNSFEVIDFFVSVNEKENIDNSGVNNVMLDFINNLQQLTESINL